jgi:transposase
MRACSVDLRHKIVNAVLLHVMSKEETASTFGVSVPSVKRYVRMAKEGSRWLVGRHREGKGSSVRAG